MEGSDWSQSPLPVTTAEYPEGQVVDQVDGLLTAGHFTVEVV